MHHALPALRVTSLRRRAPRSGVRLPAIAGGRTELGWFLTAEQRGNDATRLRPWTEGNAVRPLVHGSTYFAALAEALAQVGRGDLVLFSDWRGDPDQRLTDGGATVTEALSAAVLRGALVKGLMWRSHLDRLRFSNEENRSLAERVNDAGGEVLLDQRVRAVGSHHQKFVVIRHPSRPADDVALLGGIDLAHGRRDDAGHRGDPQAVPFAHQYGPRPPWHDVHVEIRGPAVRDVEDVFRERWEDPAALSRLPWQAVPDVLHREDREPGPLPPPAPDPPWPAPARSSSCAPTRSAVPGTRSRRTANAAPPAGTPRRCGEPGASCTSRTSTCGRPTSRGSSPPRCAASPGSTSSPSSPAIRTRTTG